MFFMSLTLKSEEHIGFELCICLQGSHGQGKVSEKLKKFKVREKSGNFESSQGNLKFFKKSGKSQGIL